MDESPQQPAAPAHPEVVILSRYEAGALLTGKTEHAAPIDAVISIGGPSDYPCSGFETVGRRIQLKFDDVAAEAEVDPKQTDDEQSLVAQFMSKWKRRKAEEMGLRVQPPSQEHAEQIVAFARENGQLAGALLCHCQAGISRSSAAAVICLATWTGPGHERYVIDYVLKRRSIAIPHHDLVRFGDDLLGREGKLLAALDELVVW